MGHRYSTVYSHNTEANMEKKKYEFPKLVEQIHMVLYPNSGLTTHHNYPVKCKLCFQSVYQQPTLILNCRAKHRYHPECIVKHNRRLQNISESRNDVLFLDCDGCRKLFTRSKQRKK